MAVDGTDGLAGQDALDAGEDGPHAGGELELEELVACFASDATADEVAVEEGARLGGEGETLRQLGDVERLDAECVAGQGHRTRGAVVDRDGEHPAEMLGVGSASGEPEVQRCFAVAAGGEAGGGQARPQLQVVVDLAVGDESGIAGE